MDAIRKSAGFDVNNWFRAPDWRWQRARELAGLERRSRRRDDPDIESAAHYLRYRDRGGSHRPYRALESWPAIHAALGIASEDDLLRDEIQARILARQSDGDIARRFALDPAYIRSYESLFFSVRERLDARDWIMSHAIGSVYDRGRFWRYTAYFGGVLALQVVIAVATGHPLPAEVRATFHGNTEYEDLRFRFNVKMAEAVARADLPEEWRSIVLIKQRAERVDRMVTGRPEGPPSIQDVHERVLKRLAPRPRVCNESSEDTSSPRVGSTEGVVSHAPGRDGRETVQACRDKSPARGN